jgi:iron complex transport system ATP-binding protein
MSISVQNFSINIQNNVIVKEATMEVRDNQITTIIGPNGAGKSTLLKAIVGDIETSEGALQINGQTIDPRSGNRERARSIAILPQLSLLNFPYTVEEVVELGRTPHETGKTIDDKIIQECLAVVEMNHFSKRFYTQLSGGEKQRVQIARVLAQIWRAEDCQTQRTLILDEPTASLDLGHQQTLMHFLQKFIADNVSILMVLHDLNTAAQYSNHLVTMKQGRIIFQGKPDDVLKTEILNDLFEVDCHVITHPATGKPIILSM